MVDPLVDLLRERKKLCAERGEGEVELEIRIGAVAERFCPGMGRAAFQQLEEDMEAVPTLQPGDRWREMVDYHYLDGEGRQMRTRVTFDSDRMEIAKKHVRKETRRRLLVRRTNGAGEEAARIALSVEVPVPNPPSSCLPSHVRVQQRRSFRDVRDGKVIWSYELSKTWSGSSRSGVEQKQHVCEPTYEVECELVDEGGAYASATGEERVAASLLAKAKLLMGEDVRCEVEVVEEQVGEAGKKKRKNKRSKQSV